MPLTPHHTQLAISMSLPEVARKSLHSLALVSRATAVTTRRDRFRILKTLRTSDLFREGTFVRSLLVAEEESSLHLARLVRSATILIESIPLTPDQTKLLSKVNGYPRDPIVPAPAFIASSIISLLPHLQHVKLALRASDPAFDISAVAHALSRLERLQSLDVTDCNSNVSRLRSFVGPHLNPALLSLRIPTWLGDHYGTESHDARTSLISNSPCLRALDVRGPITVGTLSRIVASIPHPEQLRELRIAIKSNVDLRALTAVLSVLSDLEVLRVEIVGGMEMGFGRTYTYTYSLGELKELKQSCPSLPPLGSLIVTSTSDKVLTSMALPIPSIRTVKPLSSHSSHFPWFTSSSPTSPPVFESALTPSLTTKQSRMIRSIMTPMFSYRPSLVSPTPSVPSF
ncbi:uncharacterized protein EI90DRAFT_1988454 [Cantharellus anzutake]|uniref:uncharacterized protein n=1 Tax=Cantharellus anzutake TaxID=1750568 RepID=UPI0019049E36|nr:uncharacterized protein EI90DRAFT_1988454 [Cantharellus anzutake]KAF8326045.1 hypothetical protein EI90DRAFT_1988454 [Cantharellus anzutake]